MATPPKRPPDIILRRSLPCLKAWERGYGEHMMSYYSLIPRLSLTQLRTLGTRLVHVGILL